MKRFSLLAAGFTAAALALVPAAASAQIVELGKTPTPVSRPRVPEGGGDRLSASSSWPGPPPSRRSATASSTRSRPSKSGWIVSFTVGLSNLSSSTTHGAKLPAHVERRLRRARHNWRSPCSSPRRTTPTRWRRRARLFHVTPFLGQVLQEPMSLPPTFSQFTALPIKAGDVIALTVPTWAPVLSYNLSTSKFSYRQSRRANCMHAAADQTAQSTVGETQQYKCNYTGTRVEYSATEVVNTPYPKKYVHAPPPLGRGRWPGAAASAVRSAPAAMGGRRRTNDEQRERGGPSSAMANVRPSFETALPAQAPLSSHTKGRRFRLCSLLAVFRWGPWPRRGVARADLATARRWQVGRNPETMAGSRREHGPYRPATGCQRDGRTRASPFGSGLAGAGVLLAEGRAEPRAAAAPGSGAPAGRTGTAGSRPAGGGRRGPLRRPTRRPGCSPPGRRRRPSRWEPMWRAVAAAEVVLLEDFRRGRRGAGVGDRAARWGR